MTSPSLLYRQNMKEVSMSLLEVRNVKKDFSGNVVLEDIEFSLDAGKILGLCGENGAGKSTLMNIIFGMPVIHNTGGYEGEIFFNGQKVNFQDTSEALAAGIGMVHQEFSLIPGFTAAENVMLNREPTKDNAISKVVRNEKLKYIDNPTMLESAQGSIDKLEIDLNAKTLVGELPVGYKQFLEIAREINKEHVKLLILDEPTAVLTESEAELLLAAMRKLADSGISIIFISHRLREIMQICDQVLVMRDGLVVADKKVEEVTIPKIAAWMTGRNLNDESEQTQALKQIEQIKQQPVILEIKNLYVDMPGEAVQGINLTIHEGEIFGIAGLAGQGKLGIPNGIMGIYPSTGQVIFKGQELPLNNPRKAQQMGLALVSEDRRGVGLLLDEPISWNICFNAMQIKNKSLKKRLGMYFRDDRSMNEVAEQYIKELEIKCTGPDQRVRNLSGGNQQKVCLAKAFYMGPELLLVSEPTRGIDVGAKALVLDALRKYNKENHTTIIIVSSELEELRSIAGRIAVINEGDVSGILPASRPATDFGLLMSGEQVQVEESVS